MSKIKLTKGELKRQRDALKQFQHYLPTLQLKKQQLQMKILEAVRQLELKQAVLEKKEGNISRWVGLLADLQLPAAMDLRAWVIPGNKDVQIETVNIAGANIPQLLKINFKRPEYDLYTTPFWIDQGIRELRDYFTLLIETNIIRQQIEILKQELRVTTQRVNLFEKVKIPECQENIRIIRIYLGDQQANAVGISKVAKKKIEMREEEALISV